MTFNSTNEPIKVENLDKRLFSVIEFAVLVIEIFDKRKK